MAPRFRVGRLDHVHIRVPDRDAAARWYATHLGMEPIEDFSFWAEGIDHGPIQISADGGQTGLALFTADPAHPLELQRTGVAFSVDGESFVAFARSLPCGIGAPDGTPLRTAHLVDLDLCWAFDFVDPWGNRFELNTYDHELVRRALVDGDGVAPERYWPDDALAAYRSTREGDGATTDAPT